MWLTLANNAHMPLLSLFPSDYKKLNELTFILPARTIKDDEGKITLIMVDRKELIKRLKDMFHFKTVSEITEEVKDGIDSNS